MIRGARGIVVAKELDVAAERDGRNLPAGAVPVVEADQFRTEADREGQHADAAPAGHQEVAKLVKEHDNRQNEQKRYQIADHAAAERAESGHNVEMHKPLAVSPDRTSALACLCGDFGQEG